MDLPYDRSRSPLTEAGAAGVASSAWGDSNNRSLLPEVTVLVILPNATTDLLGSLREEQNMLPAHRPTEGPRALLNYTANIFVSPAPAPAGRCHPDTPGKQQHDPQGDVSAP